MSIVINFIIMTSAMLLSMAILSVLLVRFVSTKILSALFVISLLVALIYGFRVSNQIDSLITNMSPKNIIKSIDLFAN
jgi:hypothetical protein